MDEKKLENKDELNKSEIDKTIKNLEKKGKFKEVDYLRQNRDKIDHLLQPQHIWLAFWIKLKKTIREIRGKE